MTITSSKYRLAVLAPHVVQYHSPLYRVLAESDVVVPTVLFLDKQGSVPFFDKTMGATLNWDMPLLDGYEHRFVRNWSPWRSTGVMKRINPGLLSLLTPARFDGVLVQGHDSMSCYLARVLAKIRQLDVIYRGEAVLRTSETRGGKENIKRIVLRWFLGGVDAALYTCQANRAFLLHYGCHEDKLYPFLCSVDNEWFASQRGRLQRSGNSLRTELGLSSSIPVVLMVGRLDQNKRQADLVRALGILQKGGHRIGALFVGNGPERQRLSELANEVGTSDLHFVGFQNQSQMPIYYDAADLLCICSAYDASPKVVNEALNFELPVVSSDRPGTIGDAIVEGHNALIYPCGDVDALVERLRRLAFDQDLRTQFGNNSLGLSRKLTLEAAVLGLEGAIRDLQQRSQSNARQPVRPGGPSKKSLVQDDA